MRAPWWTRPRQPRAGRRCRREKIHRNKQIHERYHDEGGDVVGVERQRAFAKALCTSEVFGCRLFIEPSQALKNKVYRVGTSKFFLSGELRRKLARR